MTEEQMVANNMLLVKFCIKKIGLIIDEDWLSIGSYGLLKAIRSYNGQVKFSTYASKCIINEIYSYGRSQQASKRKIQFSTLSLEEERGENGVTLTDLIPDNSTLRKIEKSLNSEMLESAIKNLSEKEQEIIRLRFIGKGLKQSEIAEITGTSQANVARRIKAAVSKLKKIMGNEI